MELIRIGDKLINKSKLHKQIDAMLELRMQGISQQEVARAYATDRPFISRLESLGEIRKGGRIALVAFPIYNTQEIREFAAQQGIEFSVILSDKERWAFVSNKSGAQLLNEVMSIVARLREHDIVIVVASNMRIHLAEALLDKQVIGLNMGESPIEGDKYLDPQAILNIMEKIQQVV